MCLENRERNSFFNFKKNLSSRVGVALQYNDKYLCVYQKASNLWGFPKGQLKDTESERQGACRELKEETGVDLNPQYLNNRNIILTKRGTNSHCYYFLKISKLPKVQIDNDEISDYRWMTLEELLALNTSFFTRRTAQRLIKLNI
jgi:8-oxo-dGTP pyrophosphatase MutT (NUDIX family)